MYKMVYLCILNDSPNLNVRSQDTSEIPRKEDFIAKKARIFGYNLFTKKTTIRLD